MSSAFDYLGLEQLIDAALQIGAQGLNLCVFRRDGSRQDHVATHLEYDQFGPEQARMLLEQFAGHGLGLSLGAFENMIGGEKSDRIHNQNHLLKLIRIAHLLGGDQNNVKVGTFVGYNHELGAMNHGFQRNLDEYYRVFLPIVKYAEDLGVTILYENCPMEGWRPASFTNTYNNLPAVLAARKLMYAMIPSRAHGEIYDPSHDIWQYTDPVDVIAASDLSRIHRIHVKTTRLLKSKGRTEWGGMYPMQAVDADLALKAGVSVPSSDWNRHHYEAMLPGFGGTDDMDWNAFISLLHSKNFSGPFEIENEARNSKDTGQHLAIVQGFKNTIGFLAPLLWDLDPGLGYTPRPAVPAFEVEAVRHNIPVRTIDELV